MGQKRFAAAFLAALLICLPARAQTPAQTQAQKEEKSQKEDKELEKKALALLDEAGRESDLRSDHGRRPVLEAQ